MNENRYTRLKAIKDFGYDIDWEILKNYHIGIVGVGGIGSVSAEMVTRCGLGKISLFDYDIIEEVNLNRHMFKVKHIGMAKVDVASKILRKINPDIEILSYTKDIMDPDFEMKFEEYLGKIDIILNGLDNIPAREYLNAKCIKLNVPYIDAGASRSGLSGYIHPVIPYKTACAICMNRILFNIVEEKGEPCVASLPSTMAILASIQVQEMLKYLLRFGKMIDYVMYHMVTGNFLNYTTVRDKNCPICGIKSVKDEKGMLPKISSKELNEFIDKIKD